MGQKNRDELHTFIRNEYVEGVINLVENDPQLVVAKSDRGRTSLHLAVLFGNLDIIEALINTNHQVINIPDNVSHILGANKARWTNSTPYLIEQLGRTPLHYAMAMSKMEEIGRILIHNNANKLIRDVVSSNQCHFHYSLNYYNYPHSTICRECAFLPTTLSTSKRSVISSVKNKT